MTDVNERIFFLFSVICSRYRLSVQWECIDVPSLEVITHCKSVKGLCDVSLLEKEDNLFLQHKKILKPFILTPFKKISLSCDLYSCCFPYLASQIKPFEKRPLVAQHWKTQTGIARPWRVTSQKCWEPMRHQCRVCTVKKCVILAFKLFEIAFDFSLETTLQTQS